MSAHVAVAIFVKHCKYNQLKASVYAEVSYDSIRIVSVSLFVIFPKCYMQSILLFNHLHRY